MRSCLRRPLAPGSSRVRAILVSSVMFFSLSSAIVISHLREFFDFDRGYADEFRGGKRLRDPPGTRPGGIFRKGYYAARRCGSATLSAGKLTTASGSTALPTRVRTSFMVS